MSWSGVWGKIRTDRLYHSFDHVKNNTKDCVRAPSMSLETVSGRH